MKIANYFRSVVDYFKNQEVYSKLVSRYLLFCLEILSPTKIRDGKKRISMKFVALLIGSTGICILSLSYVVNDFKCLSFLSLSDNAGLIMTLLRFGIYLLVIAVIYDDISLLVHRLINEKKTKRNEITLKHGREEFIGVLLLVISPTILALCIYGSVFFFKVNENNLPLNFRLIFLTLESPGVEWTINYVTQVSLCLSTLLFCITFIPLIFLLMNHSCWEIDQTILLLTNWNADKSVEEASEMIKSVVKRSYGMLDYLNETQRLLKFFFFFEIFIQSLNLCTNFFVVLSDPPGNITTFTMIFLQLDQAFIVCWLGNRVITRIDALAAAIYDLEWYKLASSDRKSLQILLTMSQNIRGYNGIFHEVNMETFKKILNITYSLIMFILSITFSP